MLRLLRQPVSVLSRGGAVGALRGLAAAASGGEYIDKLRDYVVESGGGTGTAHSRGRTATSTRATGCATRARATA